MITQTEIKVEAPYHAPSNRLVFRITTFVFFEDFFAGQDRVEFACPTHSCRFLRLREIAHNESI